MCCFTGVVEWVAATKIYARPSAGGRQILVYSMSVDFKDELAMVLPLPVPKNTADGAVKFISLEEYPEFFADMRKGFPQPASPRAAGGVGGFGGLAAPQPVLEVVKVGSFEASFVPKIADFARLDKRFRLPDGAWEKLPGYEKYGFAVFKLQPGKQSIHPMAFDFPRANARQIFFPTVHIHDGEVHDTAEFDHELYFQLADADYSPKRGWTESLVPAGMFMQLKKAPGFFDPELHCYRRILRGKYRNIDTLV
jgi:hypothetical protein